MFCPEGYVSIAELWDQYREKRLRDFYVSAAEHYLSDDFLEAYVRGSPLDICEHVFLRSVSKCGLCLASPVGQVAKIHAPLEDGRASLLSVLSASGSSSEWTAHELDRDQTADGITLEARGFMPWDEDSQDEGKWSASYPPLRDADFEGWKKIVDHLPFHCLPLCFERPRYTLTKTLPPWSQGIRNKGDLMLLVENFGGWAICMTETSVESWQPYLKGKGVYLDQLQIKRRNSSPGRPGRQSAAVRDFRITFPKGRDIPWKTVPDRIEAVTGNLYSESTLRRAVRGRTED